MNSVKDFFSQSEGPELAFLTYPRGLAEMPLAAFWSVAFFLMLICVGMGSQITHLVFISENYFHLSGKNFRSF